MKFSTSLVAATLGMAMAADSSSSNATIEIVGNKFFYSNNGSQFYIKGVAYQQNSASTTNTSFVDPLSDTSACQRDLPYLLQLSTNVLRVYAIDSTADHSGCMNLFYENGIYVIADLSEPNLSINRDSPSWDLSLYDRYTSVVDAMAGYANVLGFFAGNEVTNAPNNTDTDAYVKAAVRDTKAYISNAGYRSIPVGVSAADVAEIRVPEAQYFACGNESVGVDFYGINMYEWCGDSTYSSSGYQNATNNFEHLGVPLFFSEYGCNAVQPRTFQEVGTLYGDDMTDVWSGGIVYMYFEEENNYGLVSVSGSSVSTLDDFPNLSSALATISPSTTASSDVSTVTRTTCPSTGDDWDSSTDLPPTPNRGLCECISDAAACRLKDGVDSKAYADIFNYVCAHISCDGINGNSSTGEYGAFAGCDDESKLNYVLNLYYSANGKSSNACDFSGSATVASASTGGACSAVISQAGTAGTGSVSASVSATGSATKVNSASASGSGSGSSAKASGSKASGSSSGSSSNGAIQNIQLCGTLLGSIALVFLGVL